MKYALGNMLNGAGGLNPDGLSLDLQFAADKTLTARKGPTPVFTRASTATFVGSNGLIQSAAINAARFDHDPVTLASKGLLIEESRTNLALQSESFASTSWDAGIATRTADQITSPSGTTTADLITSIAGNYGGKVAQTISFAAATYTASVFIKKGNWRYIGITLANISNGGRIAMFDFDTETAVTNGVTNAVVGFTKHGNGWYRFFVTLPTPLMTGTFDVWLTTSTGVVIGPIGANQTCYFWGAQLEAGSFPTSYIPTTTASVVRSADVCSISGSDFSGMWNPSEGTALSKSSILTGATIANPFILDFYNTVPHELGQRLFGIGIQIIQRDGIVKDINLSNISSQPFSIANSFNSLSSSGSVYGSLITGSGLILNNFSAMEIGRRQGGTTYLSGHILSIRYYRKRLANTKLQTLTV